MNVYDWKDGKLQLPASVLPRIVPAEAGEAHAPQGAGLPPSAGKPKRNYVQSFERANVVSRSTVRQASFQTQLSNDERFVPVSFVAKDWKVTPRRIRSLLSVGRLAGRLQENGYWEVRYPYFLSLGTRGPALKHQQRVAAKSERRAV
jgi:hypothetical protein